MVMNNTAFFSHTILGIYQETSEHLVQFYSLKGSVMFLFQANSYDTAYPSFEDQIKQMEWCEIDHPHWDPPELH